MESILKWCAKHKVFTVSVIFFSIVVVPFIPFVRSGIGTVIKEDAIIFLQYYGTILAGILGGFLTLCGVWWTINEQNRIRKEDQTKRDEERREELINQYKPIITIKPCSANFIFLNSIMETTFTIANRGRGEATDISLELENENCTALPVNFSTSILMANDEMSLKVNVTPLQAKKEYNEMVQFSSDDKFKFVIKIRYKGAFSSEFYLTKAKIQIENALMITSPITSFDEDFPRSWIVRVINIEHSKEAIEVLEK